MDIWIYICADIKKMYLCWPQKYLVKADRQIKY